VIHAYLRLGQTRVRPGLPRPSFAGAQAVSAEAETVRESMKELSGTYGLITSLQGARGSSATGRGVISGSRR
jgi:hypothetical protein